MVLSVERSRLGFPQHSGDSHRLAREARRSLAMGEKKFLAKLTKKLGREPSAEELSTARELLKARKQAAADAAAAEAPAAPTVPAAAKSAQKRPAAAPAAAAAAKKPRAAKKLPQKEGPEYREPSTPSAPSAPSAPSHPRTDRTPPNLPTPASTAGAPCLALPRSRGIDGHDREDGGGGQAAQGSLPYYGPTSRRPTYHGCTTVAALAKAAFAKAALAKAALAVLAETLATMCLITMCY